jgi:hypothetical protein
MFAKKNNRVADDERLDAIGRAIVRASASNETEAEAVAAAPFLYARLRARLAAERERREEREGWLALLGVVWRAVPAMALVAVVAFFLFLSASSGTRAVAAGFSDEALLDARDAGVEHVVFADTRAMSSDDVLATILNDDEREAPK